MIPENYKEPLDNLNMMARNFVDIHETVNDLSTVLVTVGMLVAAAADVYNLSPRGGLMDIGAMFTGLQEPPQSDDPPA